jgi:ABC-type glycerol-3-phosphate transport system substrate-binding protein
MITPSTLAFLFLCLLLAGCAGCNEKRTVITILGENSGNLQSMRANKDSCERSLRITLDFKGNSFEETLQKANDDFVSGTGYYDIVLEYNLAISSFVRNNYVYTKDELTNGFSRSDREFEDDIFDSAWREIGYYYKLKNKMLSAPPVPVGYPFAANTMLLVYNQELFKKQEAAYLKKYGDTLGAPRTWRQFKQIADFFTDTAQNTYGLCMTGGDGGWLYYEYCSILYGMGGVCLKKTGAGKGIPAHL